MGSKKKVNGGALDALNKQLARKPKATGYAQGTAQATPSPAGEQAISPSEAAEDKNKTYSKWNTSDGNIFTPAHVCTDLLPPGLYDIRNSQSIGLYFTRLNISTESILKLPDSNSDKVIREIVKFWNKEEIFKKYELTYKRGILLWGPPGSGKTCTIKLIIDDVVKRGGIALKFGHPDIFSEGIRILRDIQPDTPIVVLMEDLDTTIEHFDESLVINILDGVDRIDKVAFLATTNYPEKLGPRIINRPSRFDRRYKIGYPTPEAREMYLKHLFKNDDVSKFDIKKWVEDTDEMSLAHLRELFVAVVILGNSYTESIELLMKMRDNISDENGNSVGFDIE
jgi:hypothetical protein